MQFALCQVLRRLMSRKGRGILEMLQMILSFFLMTCCLNLFLSTSALGAREDISDHTVSRIQWTQRTNGGLLQNGYAGFSRDDYEAVRTVSSAELVYATWYSTLVQPSARTENIKEIFLIFAPRDSLPLLGEITLADADMPIYHASAVGLSAEAADALARAQTAGECCALNPGSIAQNLLRNGYAREDISLTNVFAVPMEYMADFDAADTLGVYLTADFASADAQAIVCLLYQHHPTGIEYCVLPMNSRMTVSLDRASDQARDFMMYSTILLAAVSIGLIGSMLTRWSKRKKEYAVLRCLGVPGNDAVVRECDGDGDSVPAFGGHRRSAGGDCVTSYHSGRSRRAWEHRGDCRTDSLCHGGWRAVVPDSSAPAAACRAGGGTAVQ